MPRLSRPTLKPKASSAWVTALSSDRDWASAGPAITGCGGEASQAEYKRGRTGIERFPDSGPPAQQSHAGERYQLTTLILQRGLRVD